MHCSRPARVTILGVLAISCSCGGSERTTTPFFGSLDASQDSFVGAGTHPVLSAEAGAGSDGGASCVHASDCAPHPCMTAACVGAGGQETTAGRCVYSSADGGACGQDATAPLLDAEFATDAFVVPDVSSSDATTPVIDSSVPDAIPPPRCGGGDAQAPTFTPGAALLVAGWLPSDPSNSGLFSGLDWYDATDTWQFDGAAWTPLCGDLDAVLGNFAAVNGEPVVLVQTTSGILDTPSTAWTYGVPGWTSIGAGPAAFSQGLLAPQGGGLVFLAPEVTVDGGTVPAATWTWQGGAWAASPASSPATFDVYNGTPTVGGRAVALSDDATWVWDGTAWTMLAIPGPPPRSNFAVAPLGDKLVLFGGIAPGIVVYADTWTFDGSSWTELAVTGPSAREGAVMAPVKGKIVLYGGLSEATTLGDTWTFDGTAWSKLPIAGPPARWSPLMATP